MFHRIIEFLKLNHGIPASHWEGKKLIMCFKCSCGKLTDCFDITRQVLLWEKEPSPQQSEGKDGEKE